LRPITKSPTYDGENLDGPIMYIYIKGGVNKEYKKADFVFEERTKIQIHTLHTRQLCSKVRQRQRTSEGGGKGIESPPKKFIVMTTAKKIVIHAALLTDLFQ